MKMHSITKWLLVPKTDSYLETRHQSPPCSTNFAHKADNGRAPKTTLREAALAYAARPPATHEPTAESPHTCWPFRYSAEIHYQT